MKFNLDEIPENLPSIEAVRGNIYVSRETFDYWITQLAKASKMDGGAMDSESRHLELARNRKLIIDTLLDDLRSKL